MMIILVDHKLPIKKFPPMCRTCHLYKTETACYALYENNSSASDNAAEGGTINSYKYNVNNVTVFPLTSTLESLGK